MKFISDNEINERIYINECYLLGQVPLNDEEHESIINYTKDFINLDEKYIDESHNLRLSLGLVLIAITDFNEGKYWENVASKLGVSEITPNKQKHLGKIFLNTVKQYNLFKLKQSENDSNKYVENIKAHAFVTNNYMFGYYDFLFDYYENNLFRNINEDVEETLQDLSDYIKLQKSDTVYSDSLQGKTTKSYKLLKSTRAVIAQCNGDLLYKLFYPSLKIIDENFYDGILPENSDDRFANVFINWKNEKDNKKEIICRNINERRHSSRKPYLVLNTNKYCKYPFSLYIPSRRLRPTECDGSAIVTLTINGISRKSENLEIYRKMGSYITEEKVKSIGYPFDEIKIEIDSIEKNKFVIPSSEYAIFNSECVKVNRLEIGNNYLLVKKGCNVNFSDDQIVIDVDKTNDEWDRYDLIIDEYSTCYINGKPLTIIGEFSKEPIFENIINDYKVFNNNHKQILAVKEHPLISFELDKSKFKGTTIQINKKNISLKDKHIVVFDSPINNNQYIVSFNLNEILDMNEDYYKVELNCLGESNKLITEYCLLNNLSFKFDKRRYIYESEGKFSILNKNLKIEILDKELEWLGINRSSGIEYYKFELNSNFSKISLKWYVNQSFYFIEIPIKMMLYGFSKDKLCYGKLKPFWYRQLQELVYIKLPDAIKLGVYSGKNHENIIWGKEVEEELYRINLIEIKQELKNINKLNYYVNIKYIDNSEHILDFLNLIRKVRIDPYFELSVYNNILCFDSEFESINGVQIFFDIYEQFSTKCVIKHRELVPGINYLPELSRNVYYNIIPYLEESDEFGINKNIESMPMRTHKGIIDLNFSKLRKSLNLSKIPYIIDDIYCNYKNLNINKNVKYKLELEENEKGNYYYGTLYEISTDFDKNIIKENINKVSKIRAEEINGIRKKFRKFKIECYSYNDNDWYSLYYNKLNKELLDINNQILDDLKFDEAIELNNEQTVFNAILLNERRKII